MSKWAIAEYDNFDCVNRVHIVEAETPIEAIATMVHNMENFPQDFMDNLSVDEAITALYSYELAVSRPVNVS